MKHLSLWKYNDFPNLGDVHVTYATYFRMFIDKYLPRNLEYFIYVDADILCLKDPKNELDKIFDTLKVTGQCFDWIN